MEIGSEFHNGSSAVGINSAFSLSNFPCRFLLSGRSGLYMIAEELKGSVNRILLPEYCCGSMVAPFVAADFNIGFYDSFNAENIIADNSREAVLIMDYFGFMSEKTVDFALMCKSAGKVVIVDATQSAFSKSAAYEIADYILVSYRKWTDSLCAALYSKAGFKTPPPEKLNEYYNEAWRAAAALKADYINNAVGDKADFLALYSKANHMLSTDFIGYAAGGNEINRLSCIDSSRLIKARRSNAEYLLGEIKKLSECYNIKPMFEKLGEFDCPLFFPILLDETERGIIRAELIKNAVYCPVHWPIDASYPYIETIYHKTELSLICDQRYGLKEMKKQISVLTQALRGLDKRT